MTALSVTATEVLPSTAAVFNFGTIAAAVTVTAGAVVYLDTTTNTYKLFDANLTGAKEQRPEIALNGGGAGQPIKTQYGGLLTIGATAAPTAGLTYCAASAVAGTIIPSADITTGDRVSIIGVATSSSQIQLICWNSGATK